MCRSRANKDQKRSFQLPLIVTWIPPVPRMPLNPAQFLSVSVHTQPKQVLFRRKMADWRLHSTGNVPGHRGCSPGRRHRGRFPVHRRLTTEDGPVSHKWLAVTYNIAASVVTPHRPLDLWVGAASRTNLEVWGALRFGIGGGSLDDGIVRIRFPRLHEAASLGRGLFLVPEAAVSYAGLLQLVGPIVASNLRFGGALVSVKSIQIRDYFWQDVGTR